MNPLATTAPQNGLPSSGRAALLGREPAAGATWSSLAAAIRVGLRLSEAPVAQPVPDQMSGDNLRVRMWSLQSLPTAVFTRD